MLASDTLGLESVVYWSADDIDTSLAYGPASACSFQTFPVLLVENGDLGADVAHVEAIVHGIGVPFHVGCRAHVSTIISGVGIIG